ncbi:MAG: hypothetical protein SRB2_02982 [Desulfobacteraceae bacterium Eth-SRB2]|nr:MAG: hypothetical protein SRB2_02982 [Desulfobacteraceae bacterium Eth-SRB2]
MQLSVYSWPLRVQLPPPTVANDKRRFAPLIGPRDATPLSCYTAPRGIVLNIE